MCSPIYSKIAGGIVNLDHSLVLRILPMTSSDAATAREPPTPHHSSEPIDEQESMNSCQRDADTQPVSFQLDVITAHETKAALRRLPGADFIV